MPFAWMVTHRTFNKDCFAPGASQGVKELAAFLRPELEARLRACSTEQQQVLRIRIVLEAAEGTSTREFARELDTTPTTVSPVAGAFCPRRAGWP
jgi:hypothetical protein